MEARKEDVNAIISYEKDYQVNNDRDDKKTTWHSLLLLHFLFRLQYGRALESQMRAHSEMAQAPITSNGLSI